MRVKLVKVQKKTSVKFCSFFNTPNSYMNNRKMLDWLYAMCYSSIVRNEHARYQRKEEP